MRIMFRGRRSIWGRGRVAIVAPRIVNSVSYVTRINDEGDFSWQVQYLVMLEDENCPGIVNDVSNVKRMNHENHFSWQAQYLGMWEGGICCSPL